MVKSLDEFCVRMGEYPICDLMPAGVKSVQASEKRRAIGFGREDELIKNGPSENAHAAGFGKESESPATPPKRRPVLGFRAVSKAKEHTR